MLPHLFSNDSVREVSEARRDCPGTRVTPGRPSGVQSLIAPADRKSPADYRAATEFIARNDANYPARAVKNGDGRYWLFVTRKPDLVHDRSSTHRQPPSSDAYLRPFEAQGALSGRDVRMFSQESARGPRAAHAKRISLVRAYCDARVWRDRGILRSDPRKSGARCRVYRCLSVHRSCADWRSRGDGAFRESRGDLYIARTRLWPSPLLTSR